MTAFYIWNGILVALCCPPIFKSLFNLEITADRWVDYSRWLIWAAYYNNTNSMDYGKHSTLLAGTSRIYYYYIGYIHRNHCQDDNQIWCHDHAG